MKYYEEWHGMMIEIDDTGELNVQYSMSDNDVSDQHYDWVVERLRDKGITYND